jgi:hypothetical protein
MQMQRLIACACLAAASTACGHHDNDLYATRPTPVMIVGSGRVITEQRPVSGFTSIAVSAGIQAVVTLGGNESLEITAEDNIAPIVDAVISDGRLTIGFRPGSMGIRTSVGVACRIGARALRRIEGSGASRIQMDGIDARELSVELSGAASFAGSGSVDRLRMDLSGASHVTAPSLRARDADAALSGASVTQLRVVDALAVRASGLSLLEYFGDPTVQADTSGGSVVRRVGP